MAEKLGPTFYHSNIGNSWISSTIWISHCQSRYKYKSVFTFHKHDELLVHIFQKNSNLKIDWLGKNFFFLKFLQSVILCNKFISTTL